ncbi:hypothetical protein DERP_005306 [Dermatophagoides pteronyssinus]|uniref:Uncharacterized protein n=1 Tax=Dermatophagoides pteronyssinus TaxID=6956 RepID=A0ABQ8JM86_DERPT|nr:hypothetical protein DERP_005306 [Dermatophagoides pteronyssinus]
MNNKSSYLFFFPSCYSSSYSNVSLTYVEDGLHSLFYDKHEIYKLNIRGSHTYKLTELQFDSLVE